MATPFLTSLDERFTLFGERFVPTTNMFTFVRADPQTLIVGNTEWANSLNNYLASWRHEDLSVEEGLASLEPLCGDDYRVELIVPTRNPEWAAVFSNSFAGGSGTSPYWAESNLSADTVMVSLARSVRTGEFGRGQLGGCQFAYNRFVDGGVREHYSVSVINEGSSRPRWRFLHSMAFADFEDRGAVGWWIVLLRQCWLSIVRRWGCVLLMRIFMPTSVTE
ncbi:hypothetical protein [Schaalia canis]|uniref:Uncharacterized protein n=1 Tax=Schaalia canis TaxID=100469 RepID=A0A3P1SC09_9ACTO|nr:hypothetical protein [Schaalia canis]RRC94813.1 hypothetical protein EII11_07955 [Schaalia canis]